MRLVVGPLLRYVDETSATIWVETDQPCRVRVLDAESATFSVHGHHYALVDVTGLAPGSVTPYEVRLDDERVWPEAGSELPPSRIRTHDHTRPFRLIFGSCRTSVPHDDEYNRSHGVDVLRAFAQRCMDAPEDEWPDALLLLGDQVYADEPSPTMLEFIQARRDVAVPPGKEVKDFEEYAHLYALAWSDPVNRWALSTIPSLMIFDDHDIRDDWNTSATWREQMAATPWWSDRIVGGLASYWIYQHLGNLSPAERASDPTLQELMALDGDGGDVLDAMASHADSEPSGHRWSYVRDLGRNRLIVLDSRCGRVLEPGARRMLDEDEWSWFDELARGDLDHLLIGTSLPYLLPRSLHDLERWDEAVADGAWGRRARQYAERIRQGVDLEHWAAFEHSFNQVASVLADVSSGHRGVPPATVVFLSGDVHNSYLMEASTGGRRAARRSRRDPSQRTRIYQAVCSPIRNPLSKPVRYLNAIASNIVTRALGRVLRRCAGLPYGPLAWSVEHGPKFDNALATIELDGRDADLKWETATYTGEPDPELTDVAAVSLTGTRRR